MLTMKFGTRAIHAGQTPDKATGAIMTPIYQTSTYRQFTPGDHLGFEYSRGANPTRKALEECLASLENTRFGLVFSSGMAAIDTVLRLLKPGDEVIASADIYGGTYRLLTRIYEAAGVKSYFVDLKQADSISDFISDKTRLLWIESPTNPTLQIVDIKALCDIAHKHNILVAVDNTFASPYLQNPVEQGADIVMHSATKYLSGHSDVVMGALMLNDEELFKRLKFIYNTVGATPAPMDCFLVLRGVKTLHLRMQAHCNNASKVAHFLKGHPAVDTVYWPGFEDHQNHAIAKRQMRDYGGVVSFTLRGADLETTSRFTGSLKVFTLAESLGGVESLINHSARMTHGSLSAEERLKAGVPDNLIRLSVGIEDLEDLLEDIELALLPYIKD